MAPPSSPSTCTSTARGFPSAAAAAAGGPGRTASAARRRRGSSATSASGTRRCRAAGTSGTRAGARAPRAPSAAITRWATRGTPLLACSRRRRSWSSLGSSTTCSPRIRRVSAMGVGALVDACVGACVRAGVRAWVRERVCVCGGGDRVHSFGR